MKSEDIKQQNYEKIKSTASVLFFIQGIEASNIYQIAAASGISKVSIYKHFESKYDIAKEILFEHMESFASQLRLEWEEAPADTGAMKMRRLLNSFTLTAQDDLVFYALFLEYAMYLQRTHKSQIPKLFERFDEPIRDLFISALNQGRKDGSLNCPGSDQMILETVLGVIRGTCMTFFLKNAGDMNENCLEELNIRLRCVVDGCLKMMEG